MHYLRTSRHPSAAAVAGARSFDDHYDAGATFEEVYQRIVDELLVAAREHGKVLYAVPGSPYFILADGTVRGEGVASSPAALASLIADALDDAALAAAPARSRQVDEVLAAAGIRPGDPSLYPGREAGGGRARARSAERRRPTRPPR